MSAIFSELNGQICRNNRAVATCAGMVLTGNGMVGPDFRRPGRSFLMILFVTLGVLTLAKAAALVLLGADVLEMAVADLMAGSAADRAAAFVLKPGALSLALAGLSG